MKLPSKIQELKLRASTVSYTNLAVDSKGNMIEEGTIKGYLSVWGVKDSYGTIMVKGCCARSIEQRGPESQSKYKIPLLWQHDLRDPIAQLTKLTEDDYGLYFEAAVDDVPNGQRALRQIKSGTLNQFSIGFGYVWDKMEYEEETDSIIVKEIELYEGSVVTMGSNAETYAMRTAEQLKTDKEDLIADTEDFIKTIPRKQQLELRQIIDRHISLSKVNPDELRQNPLNETDPEAQDRKPNFKNILKII